MTAGEGTEQAKLRRTIEAVWRIESPKLIGALVRFVRDVGLAEELAQDALLAAMEQWPRDGVPDNPGASCSDGPRRCNAPACAASCA